MDVPARTLVLDPGQRFIPCKNLNSQASAANGFAAVASWAAKKGITVILLWHVNKLPKRDLNDPFDRIAGSHAIQGYCSTKAYLEVGNESEPIRLYIRGQRFREMVVKLVREENGAFRIADTLDEIRADFPVYCVLPENEVTRQEIIRLCGISPDEAISNLSERTIDRQLKELVELGHVSKCGHGRYNKKVVSIRVKPMSASP